MHYRFGLAVVGTVALMASAIPGLAQDAPQMTGIWKGDAIVVHIGSNPYRVAKGKEPNFPENRIEFTYEIVKQEGNRFSGTATGGAFSETIIGAISPDNRSGIILDEDGQYDFTVVDSNTLNACYQHNFPTSRVVGCWQLKRL